MSLFYKFPKKIIIMVFFDLPFLLKFIFSGCGKEYNVGKYKKLLLSLRVIYNNIRIESLSTYYQHLVIIEDILNTPKSIPGDVVECGCFNGASTANLSIACSLTNRKLFVCDTFQGLPEPKNNERVTIRSNSSRVDEWKESEMKTYDGLEGIKRNILKYGNLSVCRFVKGYFKDSLKNLDTENIICVFEDAVLASSVKDCIMLLWPKLETNMKLYCHEPWSVEVVGLFYDKQWWNENLGIDCPGFYGSGEGVKIGLRYLKMGYSIKFQIPKQEAFDQEC